MHASTHRGGVLQRITRGEQAAHRARPSGFAHHFIELWALGLVSGPLLQRSAEIAVDDGLDHEELVEIMDIGHRGDYPGNTRRDLLRKMLRRHPLPLPKKVHVPLAKPSPNDHDVEYGDVAVMMPSTTLHMLYHRYIQHFRSLLGRGLANFWSGVHPDDPKIREHPMLDVPGWQRNAIPVVLHIDSVQYVKDEKTHPV